MAIFGKEQTPTGEPRSNASNGDGSLSIIAPGMKVIGDIETEGVLKVEGRVEGSIRAGRQVLIGRQGEVKGDISTREAVIGGKVQGTIHASERVEIQTSATAVGDINTKSIAVSEGGRINGTVRISDAAEQPVHRGEKAQPVAVLR